MIIKEPRPIVIEREESGFDRACDAAYRLAIGLFGIDEYGHSNTVSEYQRSTDWIELKFVCYQRSGGHHVYEFSAWIERSEE